MFAPAYMGRKGCFSNAFTPCTTLLLAWRDLRFLFLVLSDSLAINRATRLKLCGPATSAVKQSNNFHNRTFQTVGSNIWSALDDQLSRSESSSWPTHLRKIGKLFNSPRDNVELFFSCWHVIVRDEVKRGLELCGSSTGPPYTQLACSRFSCPTRCPTHEVFMVDHFTSICLTKAFFDQRAVVFMKREILSHCFIDNKASVPLLYFCDGV
jgi:hypothetical protein